MNRVLPELNYILREEGFESSVCDNRFITEAKVTSLWIWLFIISKLAELLDTVFIVLRKQRLIFLHWYHHSTALFMAWFGYSDLSSTARWFININYGIHSVMYSYYALRALNVRIPKGIAIAITISQTIQMIFGLFVTLFALYHKSKGTNCKTSYSVLYCLIVIFVTYFILFVNFFINSYLKTSNEKQIKNKFN